MFESGTAAEQLRWAREAYAATDLASMPTGALADATVDLRAKIDALEGQYLLHVRALDKRAPLDDLGHPTASSLLAHRCRTSGGAAADTVRLARALEEMPATHAALAAAEISTTQARMLARAAATAPAVFARDERILLENAKQLTLRDLRIVTERWRALADAENVLEESDRQYEARRLHLSQSIEGLWFADACLTPEGGEVVSTAICAVAEIRIDGDERAPAQRRHDALVDICRAYLDSGETPIVGGERPHMTAFFDLETLDGLPGHRAEFDSGTTILPDAARRLACDASVSRIITNGASEPLDLGRSTRTVPAPLRRAIVARDRHCQGPGCCRPGRWTEVHHIVFWADGGLTEYWNLVLLCSYHHHLVHEGGWKLSRGSDRRLIWTPPCGANAPPDELALLLVAVA